jgi:hypothetical protein
MRRRLFYLLTFLSMLACGRAPSRSEALAILRATKPALDTATAVVTVWQDGPPWFSFNEVIAKFRSRGDSATVRKQVGNWRTLVLADWVVLRDTASGPVVEPGWCAASLRDSTARLAAGWQRVQGDSLPSGSRRRGWSVPAGRQRVVVKDAPREVGRDSVRVAFLLTIAPNANGVALGADRDTVQQQALFRREDGKWVVVKWN